MKKTIWIIILLILAIIIGFFVGVYLYNKDENKKQLENSVQNALYNNTVNNTNTVEIQTSVAKEKISINTEVVEEIYYIQCDHLIRNTRKDIKSIVNMTKEELAKKYPDWEIKEFSTAKVTLYKEDQGFCDEHYLVKDVDGVVTIYNMDNEDKINDLIEITEIETKYLTETDQEDLKEGIRVYTEQKLNKLIEDFE
ncbi:MAG: BofC C-terminal domain-containing protein [Clostridia bacterium]|nr:BofC C-terminal domain-containing protein [Clostridia bacterium]